MTEQLVNLIGKAFLYVGTGRNPFFSTSQENNLLTLRKIMPFQHPTGYISSTVGYNCSLAVT